MCRLLKTSICFTLFFGAALCLLGIGQGCTSSQDIENARISGAEAGQKAGQRAATATEFSTSYKNARDDSYTETLSRLYLSGDYYRHPVFELIVVAFSFTLGYILQYGILYSFRATGFLTDVDWIVLSDESKQNLIRISDRNSQTSLIQGQSTLVESGPNNGHEIY
jgi:hypothetical protein